MFQRGAVELRMQVLHTHPLLIGEQFMEEANITTVTYDVHHLGGFFPPLDLTSVLTACSPSKPSVPNRGMWPCRPAPLWFSSQFCPHLTHVVQSVPGSHHTAQTPSSSLPPQTVSQPPCDSTTACLCLQQAASSCGQIISLLKSSDHHHGALPKSSCQPPALPPQMPRISTGSSVLHF